MPGNATAVSTGRLASTRISRVILLLGLVLASAQAASAQEDDFEDLLDSYLGVNAEGYLRPAAELLGATLNGGFTRTAAIPDGFHLRLALAVPISEVGDDQKRFQATTEGNFRPQQTASAPTIVGEREPIIVQGEEGTAYVFPAGLGIRRLGAVIPQVTLGALGTDVTLRYLAYSNEEFGDFSLLGGGVRHNITRYLPDMPVDLAVGAFYNKAELTDAVTLTALLANLQASVSASVFNLYGGLGYETSAMDVEYESDKSETGMVQIDVDGKQGVRATAGIELDLRVLKLHADVNVGTQTQFTVGLGIGN